MSQRQVMAIVLAMLQDDEAGLRTRVDQLAASLPNAPTGNPGPLSEDFAFYRGALPGAIRDGTRGNILVTPARWVTNPRYADSDMREGTVQLEIGYETGSASHEDNVDQALLVATALAQCMDSLRPFNDAHRNEFGDCVKDVAEGADFSFGDFEGGTTYGFVSRWTILEGSYDD